MLSYFLITWVVAFFVLCLPILFITEKEKKTMNRTYSDIFWEFAKKFDQEVLFPSNNKIFKDSNEYIKTFEKHSNEYNKALEEHMNEYKKLTKKREDILFRTSRLNMIFLFILPYIIFFEVKNSYYIISLVYLIFIIFFIIIIPLTFLAAAFGGAGSSNSRFILNLLYLIFYGPGEFVVNLAVK